MVFHASTSLSANLTVKKDGEVFSKRYQKQKRQKKHLARDLQNACNR
ncbi:hypothetical protein STRUR_1895 [Streptococcus urinalis 2285-97]|uniref:Uncharacterized protein n=1 Tax=Streptococcus urinalis 2285-97 TaxID=764291 RepID=G5KDE7_9STRE|nr:hypothetical protein STRUR_1895 [Streptococcus urinalis 2285-97]